MGALSDRSGRGSIEEAFGSLDRTMNRLKAALRLGVYVTYGALFGSLIASFLLLREPMLRLC